MTNPLIVVESLKYTLMDLTSHPKSEILTTKSNPNLTHSPKYPHNSKIQVTNARNTYKLVFKLENNDEILFGSMGSS